MPPKDYIVYIDKAGVTRAMLDLFKPGTKNALEKNGVKIIGYVSSGSEADAIAYGEQVLR